MIRTTGRAVVAALVLTGAIAMAPAAPAATSPDTSALRDAVTVEAIMEHLDAFQAIAEANDGTRVSGTDGYDESLAYVEEQLEATGWFEVDVQHFDFDYFEELEPSTFERVSPEPKAYAPDTDFATMDYSGSGDVTGSIVPVDVIVPPGAEPNTSTSGCEDADFAPASATEVQVALLQRGTCPFFDKALNAQEAGYDAAIVFNEGQEGRQETLLGTLGGVGVTIPVLGTSYAVGEELHQLAQGGEVVVHVTTSTLTETRQTANLIADTKTGRTDRTVVVGAHLDSVSDGPGINDNGSGSAGILEVALQMAELDLDPRNRVRFAWWGAEESGLVGSYHYVDSLSRRELKDIAVNLNFDMVGSPNHVRFVYDGDASHTASLGSTGSGVVEDVFVSYFESQGLESEPTAFDGRSDYDAFISAGIPAGGLFTGAEGIKTEEQASTYGGTAGEAYDPCYHAECDDITNLSQDALDEMSDAIAHGTWVFASTTSAVQGTGKGNAGGASGDHAGHLTRR